MGHRPYPNVDRARRHAKQGRTDLSTARRPPAAPAPIPVPRFQWKLLDGNEQRWSKEHALEGPCPACCCNGPKPCRDCGGREHSEPVEGMTADGWESVDATMCQQEREDEIGDPAETRDLPGAI